MNDTPENDSPDPGATSTPGKILLAARTENNITLEYVCDELRLSRKQIEAIEADQIEGMPESTYLRGYIRSYARLLGLDAEQVLENFRADDRSEAIWAPDIPGVVGIGLVKQSRRSAIASPFTFVALIVVLGFLAWFAWDQDWFQLRQDIVSTPGVETPGDAGNSISETEAARAASGEITVADTAPPLAARQAVVPATAVPGEPSTAEFPVPGGIVDLTFEFSDTSWVDVRDSTERRLMYKSYTSGDYESVSGTPPFRVFIGNAAAVRMTYGGKDYDVLSHRNGMYARFEVGQGAVTPDANAVQVEQP